MSAADIARALGSAQSSGAGFKVRCPAHDDHIASLQIDDQDGKVLVHCHAGCTQSAVIGELKARGLWVNGQDVSRTTARIVSTYDYQDRDGVLLYQVVRYEPKGFKQRQPAGDGWQWNLKGVTSVPYRLPELIAGIEAGQPVIVVEGEKDVLALAHLGIVATCNAGGAGKWRKEWSSLFVGARVCILPDNDQAGRDHAEQVRQCLQGVASSVAILTLPGLPDKGDVSDWLAAGGDRNKLLRLVEQGELRATAEGKRDLEAEPPDFSTIEAPSLADLISLPTVPRTWFFESIIPAGAFLIVGRPKVGKSWLLLQLALAAAGGQSFLGYENVDQADD